MDAQCIEFRDDARLYAYIYVVVSVGVATLIYCPTCHLRVILSCALVHIWSVRVGVVLYCIFVLVPGWPRKATVNFFGHTAVRSSLRTLTLEMMFVLRWKLRSVLRVNRRIQAMHRQATQYLRYACLGVSSESQIVWACDIPGESPFLWTCGSTIRPNHALVPIRLFHLFIINKRIRGRRDLDCWHDASPSAYCQRIYSNWSSAFSLESFS